MIPTIACALDIPLLAEAAQARGLQIVPHGPGVHAHAALVAGEDDPAARVTALRAEGWLGPLMLVLAEGANVAQALDAGADDAVALPACAGEIAARLAARLRPASILVGDLRIDPVARSVSRAGRAIRLLPREYALLLHLARQPGRPASRMELLDAVWGLRFDPGTNVVEVQVSRLRARIDRGFAYPMLRTHKGHGYSLEVQDVSAR